MGNFLCEWPLRQINEWSGNALSTCLNTSIPQQNYSRSIMVEQITLQSNEVQQVHFFSETTHQGRVRTAAVCVLMNVFLQPLKLQQWCVFQTDRQRKKCVCLPTTHTLQSLCQRLYQRFSPGRPSVPPDSCL